MLRERGEKEKRRERSKKKKRKKERETRRGGSSPPRNYYCPTGFFSAHRRLVSTPLLFLLHLRTQGANVPALQFRAKIANGAPREKERRRRVCLVEEKKRLLVRPIKTSRANCASISQNSASISQEDAQQLRFSPHQPAEPLALWQFAGAERDATRRVSRERARAEKGEDPEDSSERSCFEKQATPEPLSPISPPLSRARALFSGLSHARCSLTRSPVNMKQKNTYAQRVRGARRGEKHR